MLIFSPLIYLFVGLGLGRTKFEIKGWASAFLTMFVIPLVIIFNIATHRPGVFLIMLGIVCIMCVMLLTSGFFTRDPIRRLCFFYLNIGWLGLPIASTLFGDGAAMVIIAAYVGSSLFGNSVGVGLMVHDETIKTRVIETLRAPPVWALLVGFVCIPFKEYIEEFGTPAYEVLKFIMGFLGMAILGIWLSQSHPKKSDMMNALVLFASRSVSLFVLISLFIFACGYFNINLVTNNKPTLYLICFLPPAANIIVLETHYLKTGRSASMIAWGTCISIVAIILYLTAVTTFLM